MEPKYKLEEDDGDWGVYYEWTVFEWFEGTEVSGYRPKAHFYEKDDADKYYSWLIENM